MQTTGPRYDDSPFFLFHYNNNAEPLFVHGACSSLAGIGLVGLGLGDTLGEDLGVLILFWNFVSIVNYKKKGFFLENTHGLVLDLLGLAALESETVALVLQALGGDQSLDLGSLGVRLLALALGLDLSSDDVLADLLIYQW